MFISTKISSVTWNSKHPVFSVNVANSETYYYTSLWGKFNPRKMLLRALSDYIKHHNLFEDYTVRTKGWNNDGDAIVWEVENALEEV